VIRVLIADDHAMVRAGLQQLIGAADDLEVVATAADGEEAVRTALELEPDIVLMDLEMPNVDGVEATRRLTEAEAAARVVILTSFSDRDRILSALDAGAIGYLLKDTAPDELLRDIRVAAAGDSPLSPRAARVVLTRREPTAPRLTDREEDVLRLLVGGLSNKNIARELGISEKTVKTHLTSVFRRVGVDDRTNAALWAERHFAASH
jgi:DNA-binding NarL/FixJ family response regulator